MAIEKLNRDFFQKEKPRQNQNRDKSVEVPFKFSKEVHEHKQVVKITLKTNKE